jgi:hypothetical protein
MRLGQLARRLSLRPAQIVEFLANNNIQLDPNSNTRLEDSHVSIIVQKYAPESLTAIVSEPDEIEEVAQVIEVELPIAEPVVVQQPLTEEVKTTEEIEVIRVPKIELSGLKVLGKIELPEPKKKEPVTEQKPEEVVEGAIEGSVEEKTVIEKPVRPRNPNRKPAHQKRERSQQHEWKNPLELKREREARETEDKKRRDIERERERRKKHYEEKVKAVAQPKRAKAAKEQPVVRKRPVDTRPVPKTWFGKFLRWWTT